MPKCDDDAAGEFANYLLQSASAWGVTPAQHVLIITAALADPSLFARLARWAAHERLSNPRAAMTLCGSLRASVDAVDAATLQPGPALAEAARLLGWPLDAAGDGG